MHPTPPTPPQGPCPQVCRGLVEKTCGCGKTTRVVQCHEPVKCERRCAALRSCGRHPCKRRCCNGVDCPPCEEVGVGVRVRWGGVGGGGVWQSVRVGRW